MILKHPSPRTVLVSSLFSFFILSACGSSGSTGNTVLPVEEAASAQTFLNAIENGDAATAGSLIADDVILGLPDGRLLTGREAASDYWSSWMQQNEGVEVANATFLALEMNEPYKGVPRGKWIMSWYDLVTVNAAGDTSRAPAHVSFYLGQGERFLYMATYQDLP